MSILQVVIPVLAFVSVMVVLLSIKCSRNALDAVLSATTSREAYISKYRLFRKWHQASIIGWLVAFATAVWATTVLAFTGARVAAVVAVVAVVVWLLATVALAVASRLYKRLEAEAKSRPKEQHN